MGKAKAKGGSSRKTPKRAVAKQRPAHTRAAAPAEPRTQQHR